MQLSPAEWKVMNAVWSQREASAREIQEKLEDDPGWSYSTLKTLLARLVAKGALLESKQGRTSVFTAQISRQRARRSAVQALLDRVFDGAAAPLIQHLLKERKLSARDRAALAELLDERNKS